MNLYETEEYSILSIVKDEQNNLSKQNCKLKNTCKNKERNKKKLYN